MVDRVDVHDIATPAPITELSLDELVERWPREWTAVQGEIARIVGGRDPDSLTEFARWAHRRTTTRNPGSDGIRRAMARHALRQVRLQLATGVTEGRVRFNRWNAWLLQGLLFEHGLVRKPVPTARFHRRWRLASQRRYLMALLEPRAIYCFFSNELVSALATTIGSRSALEIAAGDGTLSRFLRARDVDVVATDDHSWADRIRIPPEVQRLEATAALRTYQPSVVVCCWPPAGNRFERSVFRTRSVETYIVIGTRHSYATGNRRDYSLHPRFTVRDDPALARLVLPPEIEPQVLVFDRVS